MGLEEPAAEAAEDKSAGKERDNGEGQSQEAAALPSWHTQDEVSAPPGGCAGLCQGWGTAWSSGTARPLVGFGNSRLGWADSPCCWCYWRELGSDQRVPMAGEALGAGSGFFLCMEQEPHLEK